MESEAASKRVLGGSLPVENVQSLASKDLQDIPHRYVRPEADINGVVADDSFQIPVIDMNKLQTGRFGFDDELAKLHFACKHWGFFQVYTYISIYIYYIKRITLSVFFFFLRQICPLILNAKF